VLAWFDQMRVPVVRTNAERPLTAARRSLQLLAGSPGVVTVKGNVPA